MTASKDSRTTHGAAGKKDLLLFDPEELTLVTDESHDLYDERVHLPVPEAMILNIMHYGVIEPVLVRKDPETGKTFVVAGRQRIKGCREANKRLKARGDEPWRVEGVVKRTKAGDAIGMMISENEHRENDTPMNKARKASRMLERGKTEEEVGIALGASVATVKNLIKLLDAPAVVRNAVDAGKITATAGYKLASMTASDAKEAVEKLVETAPRVPGKKRATKKAAAAARAILNPSDPTTTAPGAVSPSESFGRRSDHQIENVLNEVMASPLLLPLAKSAVEVFARWVLGSDEAIDELLRPGEKAAE